MIKEMGEIIKENKDAIVRYLSIALTLLFYWFGVVKSNEKTRVEIIHLQNQFNSLELKTENRMNRLDDVKADKEILNLLMTSINRIENKLDKMSK